MKESSFRAAVLQKLPATIHRQPMMAGAGSFPGTPDTYIDFNKDLWVEWKSVPGEDYYPREIKGDYLPTERQREWLARRWGRGGNAVVIVGFKIKGRAHGVILETPHAWSNPVPRETYEPLLLPAAKLAAYIEARVT